MTSRHRVLRSGMSAVALVGLVLSSCSAGNGATTASSAPPPSSAPDTAPSTTAVTDAAPRPRPPTTTTAPSAPVYPLTGLPVTDPAAGATPALVVKIDNNPVARPQSGLNEADIVFEEIVEQLTRFAAVFQSHGADSGRADPLRSHAGHRPARVVQQAAVRLERWQRKRHGRDPRQRSSSAQRPCNQKVGSSAPRAQVGPHNLYVHTIRCARSPRRTPDRRRSSSSTAPRARRLRATRSPALNG